LILTVRLLLAILIRLLLSIAARLSIGERWWLMWCGAYRWPTPRHSNVKEVESEEIRVLCRPDGELKEEDGK
jgi:hypothetical protein